MNHSLTKVVNGAIMSHEKSEIKFVRDFSLRFRFCVTFVLSTLILIRPTCAQYDDTKGKLNTFVHRFFDEYDLLKCNDSQINKFFFGLQMLTITNTIFCWSSMIQVR